MIFIFNIITILCIFIFVIIKVYGHESIIRRQLINILILILLFTSMLLNISAAIGYYAGRAQLIYTCTLQDNNYISCEGYIYE